jgi:thiol-disulfide isomerase/thioredoxin
MNKKRQNFLFISLIKLSILLFLLFSNQTSLAQSSTDRRFPKDVVQSPLPKLLDFGRGKCIPCKAMAPILKELSEEYKDRVIIKVIEIDQESGLTTANRIRLIPTQIFFDSKNQEVVRHEGFLGKDEIKKVFQRMGIQ